MPPAKKPPAKKPPAKKPTTVKIAPEDMPLCRTCAFWDPEKPTDDMGLCRRYPPKFLIEDGGTSTSFAISSDDDWCGEYRRRLQG